MVSDLLKRHRDQYGTGSAGEVFTNEAGTPLRRTCSGRAFGGQPLSGLGC
jgi:hypothetical protein